MDWNFQEENSRTIKGRGWVIFLTLKVKRPPQPHMYRQAPWRPKESCVKGCSLPICPFSKICLGEEMCVHTWENLEIYQIWTVNQANQHDWPKGTQKKCPIKVIETATMARLRDSPSESALVSIHMYCTLFLLIGTLLVSLVSIFVGIPFYKAEGSMLCHWPLV